MKSASPELLATLNNTTVTEGLVVIAEWNQNRYTEIDSIDNTPSEESSGYDIESFDINSIAEPNRPKQGLVRAFTVPGDPVDTYTEAIAGRTTGAAVDEIGPVRYYTSSPDATYKYWISPVASSVDLGGKYGFSVAVAPFILYTESCWVNKVVVQFEASVVTPIDYDIDITTDGINWTTIASDVVPTDGRVELYRQANDTWSTNTYRDNYMQIRGIRVVVTSVDKNAGHLALIELSPRLELDISSYVMAYNASFTMSEDNSILPIGETSANTGQIEIFDRDGLFVANDPSSILYNRLGKNIKFTIDSTIDTTAEGGAGNETTRIATMYSDNWLPSDSYVINIRLKDSAEILQNIDPPKVFMKDVTIGEILWRLCDMVGFNNYQYTKADGSSEIVDVFWVDDEKTLWEVLSNLALATQTAIFFDENDVLRIMHRNSALDPSKATSYAFRTEDDGADIANVISATKVEDLAANLVKVNWSTTKFSSTDVNIPRMTVVWQPESTLALRATPITSTVSDVDDTVRLEAGQANVWPFKGLFMVGTEIIRYEGKQYAYYDDSNVRHTAWTYSQEDVQKIDNEESSRLYAFKNSFTGLLKVAVRGEWNTIAAQHSVDLVGWSSYKVSGATKTASASLMTHDKNFSILKLSVPSGDASTITLAERTSWLSSTPKWYGTTLTFSPNTDGFAGIVACPGSNGSGYYIEIGTTDKVAGSSITNEINLVIRKTSGAVKRVGLGTKFPIGDGVPYRVDVKLITAPTQHAIGIFIDGINQGTFTVTSGDILSLNGGMGLYARGTGTLVSFEYAYVADGTVSDDYEPGQKQFFDWATGTFTEAVFFNDHMFGDGIKRLASSGAAARYDGIRFDEFGPIAHEIREFDVKFSESPVLHSSLYLSNKKAAIIDYVSSPFGAKFVLVNTSRNTEILNGEDDLTYRGSTVNQVAMIYGNSVCVEEPETVEIKNALSIRKNGRVEIEIANEWIQTEGAARSLADWIQSRWSDDPFDYEITIFGNPLIQLGDVVTLTHQQEFFVDKKFFVMGVTNSFANGLQTTLKLRSV